MNTEQTESNRPAHKSVLVEEVLTYLDPQPGKIYLDATFGAGGHTSAILDAEPTCKVVALDWDAQSIEDHGPALKEKYGDRLTLLWGNFALMYTVLKKAKIKAIDGALADFGTSQMQIHERDGFSFRIDSPLDMRMSPAHQHITAAHVVNTESELKLRELLYQLGGEGYAKAIARAIVERRKQKKFTSTVDLAAVVEKAVPKKGPRRVHPATKTFQALRIYVNHELDNIRSFLFAAMRMVRKDGNIVCISFHSLEDRLVKQFFREKEELGLGNVLTKKVVVPTEEELESNLSARSAKLRAFKIMPKYENV